MVEDEWLDEIKYFLCVTDFLRNFAAKRIDVKNHYGKH
jgi:hypothetical protein